MSAYGRHQQKARAERVVPYRIYEGTPIFSYQRCMKSRWGCPGARREFEENDFPWKIGEHIVK
jgi:hypothetical protein